MVSCRIQIWQILDFEILEDGLGLVVDEYFFMGRAPLVVIKCTIVISRIVRKMRSFDEDRELYVTLEEPRS